MYKFFLVLISLSTLFACSDSSSVTPSEDCSKATDIPQLTMLTSTMTNKTRFEQAFGDVVKIDSVYLKVKYVDKDGDFGLNSQSKTVAFQKMSNGSLYPIKVETLKKNSQGTFDKIIQTISDSYNFPPIPEINNPENKGYYYSTKLSDCSYELAWIMKFAPDMQFPNGKIKVGDIVKFRFIFTDRNGNASNTVETTELKM